MPIPGPRNQFGPDPGYRNPENREPDFFNQWNRPGPLWMPGRSPGLMFVNLRGNRLAAGQIRKLWRQSVNYVAAQAGFSWTTNSPAPGRPVPLPSEYFVTRALRYMTRSVYMGGGLDNSRYEGLHTRIGKQNFYKTITVNSGQNRNRPTVRNRMSSFGSRVPTLNQTMAAAESQDPGKATQA